jgi:hypothetical protein
MPPARVRLLRRIRHFGYPFRPLHGIPMRVGRDGFQPGSSVTVNGGAFTARGSGTVNLVAASLGGANTLTVGFVDGGGTPHTLSGPLKALATGTQLSQAQ